jgi:hypothetical protein
VLSTSNQETFGTATAAGEDNAQEPLMEGTTGQESRRHDPRTWRWRIEPGKEAEFEYLRGWLLSGLREAPGETAAFTHRQREDFAPSRRLSPVRSGARLAGRAAMRAGRRLLQWGNAADETETSAA